MARGRAWGRLKVQGGEVKDEKGGRGNGERDGGGVRARIKDEG